MLIQQGADKTAERNRLAMEAAKYHDEINLLVEMGPQSIPHPKLKGNWIVSEHIPSDVMGQLHEDLKKAGYVSFTSTYGDMLFFCW